MSLCVCVHMSVKCVYVSACACVWQAARGGAVYSSGGDPQEGGATGPRARTKEEAVGILDVQSSLVLTVECHFLHEVGTTIPAFSSQSESKAEGAQEAGN